MNNHKLLLLGASILLHAPMPTAAQQPPQGIKALTPAQAAQQRSQTNPKPAAYVDKLIDSSKAEDTPPSSRFPTQDHTPQAEGLRSVGVRWEALHSQPQNQASVTQHNLSIDAYRQTREYGDWRLDARLRQQPDLPDTTSSKIQRERTEITLEQNQMLLNEDWVMDNTFGKVRSFQNQLIGQAHSVNLPSTAYNGVASRMTDGTTEVRLLAGQTSAETSLNNTERKLAGASVAHQLNKQWVVGAQGWQAERDDSTTARETTLMAQHTADSGNWQTKGQLLNNAQANGIWLDTSYKQGRMQQRAGAYHLGDGLTWMGQDLADDQQGVYWDMHYTHPRYSSTSAVSLQQRTISTANSNAELRLTQSLSYQYDRATRLGGRVSHTDSSGDTTKRKQQASVYAARNWRNGQDSRLQLGITHENSAANALELDYTHHWELPNNHDLSWQINLKNEQDATGERNIQQTGLNWQHQLDGGDSFGASASLNQQAHSDGSQQRQQNARLFSRNYLNRNWELETSLQQSHDDAGKRERSATLSLRYQDTWGKPLGQRDIRSGTIRGVVFFDENNDGRQQPLEKKAANIEVLLNGRIAAQTDANGEFEFRQIGIGAHRLAVSLGSIPLPWELSSGFNDQVEVKLRATAVVAIPLTTIHE